MKLGNVAVIFRKELVDALRDRRTLISGILLPIVLFPLMMGGIIALSLFFARRAIEKPGQIMLIGAGNAPQLVERLRKIPNTEFLPATADYASQINEKKVRAAVELPSGFETHLQQHPDQPQTVKVYWYDGEFRSRRAVRQIERAVGEYREEIVQQRMAARNLSAADATPFEFEQKNVASAERVSGNILGFILPYFIIILCLTGAMYPAIDTTAGEKERGTMETIIASPALRGEIVLGKFLMVLLTSVVTTAPGWMRPRTAC